MVDAERRRETTEQTLREWIESGAPAVFFGGAGVSTESGIPDFRGPDANPGPIPVETILSREFFFARPADFYRFYFARMLRLDARPNAAHRALARLEARGRLAVVITQNIDGLHQAAGSRNVLELHGSIHRNHCLACGAAFTARELVSLRDTAGVPRCPCGGLVKPDVVLYGEPLDDRVMARAAAAIREAGALVVGGTSLSVYPAAGLLRYYQGNRLVLINKTPTPADGRADLALHGFIGAILGDDDKQEV